MTVTPHPAHPKTTLASRFKALAQSNVVNIIAVSDTEVLFGWQPGCEGVARSRARHALEMLRCTAIERVVKGTDTLMLTLTVSP
jgi:hypothetical protein